ncbi:MAG: alpha/beta hydrolase [Acidiferrobacteraceae bacterium]|nr:alpha/beta hydrolase [Acidiferrobacteraceae bacterium]
MFQNRGPDGTWYEVCGNLEGSPIVFCHGVGLDLHMWDEQIPALAGHFPLIRYDLIGHGETPAKPDTSSLRIFTEQLLTLVRHLNLGPINLVGLSMGGVIAQQFVAEYPQLVNRLVLMNTVYKRTEVELAGVRSRLQLTANKGLVPIADAAITRWFDEDFREQHPMVVNKIHKRLVSNDFEGYLNAYRVFVNCDAEINSALRGVDCPTLIITGGRDTGSTATMAFRMAADLHDARVVVFDELHHLSAVESPSQVNSELLSFLME